MTPQLIIHRQNVPSVVSVEDEYLSPFPIQLRISYSNIIYAIIEEIFCCFRKSELLQFRKDNLWSFMKILRIIFYG